MHLNIWQRRTLASIAVYRSCTVADAFERLTGCPIGSGQQLLTGWPAFCSHDLQVACSSCIEASVRHAGLLFDISGSLMFAGGGGPVYKHRDMAVRQNALGFAAQQNSADTFATV